MQYSRVCDVRVSGVVARLLLNVIMPKDCGF